MTRRWTIALTTVTAVAVVLVAGRVAWLLLRPDASLPAPAAAVERALELRAKRSTDASAYAAYFADPGIASTLASDSAAATRSPIPEWETPYVSAESSASADVVVVWRASEAYPDWPRANVFRLQEKGDAWRIVDASAVASAGAVPEPLR